MTGMPGADEDAVTGVVPAVTGVVPAVTGVVPDVHDSSRLDVQVSLRERKKARTRATIREHALRLFREQGYQSTTIDQIAGAAEVSPSTFFRYFPTKEDVVLQDDMDVRIVQALDRQPLTLSPVGAVRAALGDVLDSYSAADMEVVKESTALAMTVPEVRARALDEFARTIDIIANTLAHRAGRNPDELAVRTTAGAIVGVIMAVTMPWADWSKGRTMEDSFTQIDQALGLLRPACRSSRG